MCFTFALSILDEDPLPTLLTKQFHKLSTLSGIHNESK